jgi:hypothetical protein
LKVIPVQAAIGMVLGHDLTRIVPGEFKGPAFRRGHMVRAEDVPDLLLMGKERLYVYDPAAGLVHEDDAARRMARALAGERPTREEIVALGHGGYCADCAECRFPDCAFGKGF